MGALEVEKGDGASSSERLALIRAIRSIDDDSSSTATDKVLSIWKLLTSVKNTRLHAIEESILRWLLKHMNGKDDAADQIRRYPLTWKILALVFPNIPAQTLGRSLSQLKFVSILEKTLEDLVKSSRQKSASLHATSDRNATRKRKREHTFPSDLEELRTAAGSMKTASAVFEALSKLLELGSSLSGAVAVGAEHIKSLFSSSGNESRDITASLLFICIASLDTEGSAKPSDLEGWIDILTIIWGLRLRNEGDNLEFAQVLFAPASSLMAILARKGDAYAFPTLQMRRFISTYFIRPARQRFALDGNLDGLNTAMAFAGKTAPISAKTLWDISARTPRDTIRSKSKTEHASWVQAVFTISLDVLKSIEPSNQNDLIGQLLKIAIATGSIPSTTSLRDIYKTYALASDVPDWELISDIVMCDADVLLLDPAAIDTVFDMLCTRPCDLGDEATIMIIERIILPLERAFINGRDLTGFVSRWYGCLVRAAEGGKSIQDSLWFHTEIRATLSQMLRTSVSAKQLGNLLEWLDSAGTDTGARLVVLDSICSGVTDGTLTAAVDAEIFALLFRDKSHDKLPSEISQLRWHIVTVMTSWETSEQCDRLWKDIKSSLKRALKKSPISHNETLEAFKSCHKLCLANHIGGKYESDTLELVCLFLERMVSEVKAAKAFDITQYLEVVFIDLPLLAEQPRQGCERIFQLIIELYWLVAPRELDKGGINIPRLLRLLPHSSIVEDEEKFLDNLMAPALDALDNDAGQCGWTQPQSLGMIWVLLEFPREAWTKGRRKRIMASWAKWKSEISVHASQLPLYATAVLRLLVQVMQQPTFYTDMRFDDIVEASTNLARNDRISICLALAERLVESIFKHVAVNAEAASITFLRDASDFVGSLDSSAPLTDVGVLMLTKSLASATNTMPLSKADISVVEKGKVIKKLAQLVHNGLSNFKPSIDEKHRADADDRPDVVMLSMLLDAAMVVAKAQPNILIELPADVISRLESASESYTTVKSEFYLPGDSEASVSRQIEIGWKLKVFLVRHNCSRYDTAYICTQLEAAADDVDEELVACFVDAFAAGKDRATQAQLLDQLIHDNARLIGGPLGSLVGVKTLIGLQSAAVAGKNEGTANLADIYQQLAPSLIRTGSLPHFKKTAEILLSLLDEHASSMTQFGIETTLNIIAQVCSSDCSIIQEGKEAGEVYGCLYKLAASIIKRHRLRLRGHFPLLICSLQAMLRALLADPKSRVTGRLSPRTDPPWLISPLQPRHAERFARLLTLICEPSAASVTRARANELESATDAAKRAAGQKMYAIVETYLKLQLSGDVSQEMRKALSAGIYSILKITPPGSMRVLNESVDGNGRHLLRQLMTEYRRAGKWSGV
ncbi:Urb2/Npa2 family-domain-containing protein [Xylariaceae sp. FL0016]|nr:Urb2/Npa2 family-domain-containing protein [Xylariaceae sp. FL0016]